MFSLSPQSPISFYPNKTNKEENRKMGHFVLWSFQAFPPRFYQFKHHNLRHLPLLYKINGRTYQNGARKKGIPRKT